MVGPLSGNAVGLGLATNSPAIDVGDNQHCPPMDVRGQTRPKDGNGDSDARCDMGAFEMP